MNLMSERNAFLCFDVYADEPAGREFVAQMRSAGVALAIEDSSAKPMRPREDWDKLIRGKIGRCGLMIVLIGKGTCASEEVAHEIRVAKGANVPFFGVYLEGAEEVDCSQLGLPSNRVIPYDWTRIVPAIDQLLTEGKNHIFV